MRRDARLLKDKATGSLRRSVQAFNSLDEDGRVTSVLLHAQHAAEMIIKAALCEKKVKIFDPQTGRTVGFKKCVNLTTSHLGLSVEAAGTLRAIGALRDDEQHYLGGDDEGIIYVHLRALITLYDELLEGNFNESLADHLPTRVLPISTTPPVGIDVLIDKEYSQIQELLSPKRRRRPEARSKIRTLLAMEAHATEEVEVSERDGDRVEAGIRGGKNREEVFPRLNTLPSVTEGDGILVLQRQLV